MLVCSLLGPKPKRVAEGLFSLQDCKCNQLDAAHAQHPGRHDPRAAAGSGVTALALLHEVWICADSIFPWHHRLPNP